jgi:lipopolysaccharide biosynthesis protein
MIYRGIPPVEEATSVDKRRCICADQADPVYARLAAKAQGLIEEDPALHPYYFKQGMKSDRNQV